MPSFSTRQETAGNLKMSRTVSGPAIGGVADGRWVSVGEHEKYVALYAAPRLRVQDFSAPIPVESLKIQTSYYRREEFRAGDVTLTLFVEEKLQLVDAVRMLLLGYHPVTSFVEP